MPGSRMPRKATIVPKVNIEKEWKESKEKELEKIRSMMRFKVMVDLQKEAVEELIRKKVSHGADSIVETEEANKCMDPITGRFRFEIESCERYEHFINGYVNSRMSEKDLEIEEKLQQIKEDINLSGPLIDLRHVEGSIERVSRDNNDLIKFPSREQVREEELKNLFGGRRSRKRYTRRGSRRSHK